MLRPAAKLGRPGGRKYSTPIVPSPQAGTVGPGYLEPIAVSVSGVQKSSASPACKADTAQGQDVSTGWTFRRVLEVIVTALFVWGLIASVREYGWLGLWPSAIMMQVVMLFVNAAVWVGAHVHFS
jgi:hypothetical protein